MKLISPEEFKKNRNTTVTIEPPAIRSGGLNLISPDEFKAERTKQTVQQIQSMGEGFKQIGQTLAAPLTGLVQALKPKPESQQTAAPTLDPAIKREINMAPLNSLESFKQAWPVQDDGLVDRPPYLDRVKQKASEWPELLKPVGLAVEALAQAPFMLASREGLGTVDSAAEGYKPVSGAGKVTGQALNLVGLPLTVPGAGLSGVGMYNQAGNVVSRVAPRLGNTAGGRIAEEAIKGAAVGVPVDVGFTLATNPEATGRELAESAAFGLAGGAVLGAAGKGIGEGISAIRGSSARQTAQQILESATRSKHPSERIVQEVPASPEFFKGNEYAANLRRFDDFQKQYADEIEAQYQLLRRQRNERGGVSQGLTISDPVTGEVIDRVGRISNNPKWYQDFFATYGRVPTNKDLRALAVEHVNKGYVDDVGMIPPWRPKVVEEIDDELLRIQEYLREHPGERPGLESTIRILNNDRAEIMRQLPEEVSAMRLNRSGVQAMAQTPDGRPLLPRSNRDVGEAVSKNVTKRSDIIADLSKALGVPIRTGRYRYKAHGVFKRKPGVIRSKLTNDLPVISHEIGHALDKRYKLSSSAFDGELLLLGKETSRPDYSIDQVRNEGVAEFFRLMLTEPVSAQRLAPKFYDRYLQLVSPADKAALTTAQQRIRQYIDQDILTKSFSELSVGQREKRKLPSLNELYTKFVDDIDPIKQALKPLGDKGREIFENFWLLRGASGRAQAFLWQGVVDRSFSRIGKSYDEIITPVKQNLNEFRTYIKDKRALELADRNIMTGSDLTPEERLRAIHKMEQLHPEFKQAQQDLKDYQDALLDELIESGVLSAGEVKTFKDQNKEYVPFFRVFEAEAGAGQAKGGRTHTGSGAANQSSPIRRIKGSDREIVDPLESIIKNTYQYITVAERNKATLEFIDAVVNAENLGGLVEKIPAPMQGKSFSLEELRGTLERAGADVDSIDMDTIVSIFRPANVAPGKENVIRVFRNGKQEFYQLDPDLYRAVTAADKEQMNFLVRAANMPVRMLRSGIVNTLEFWFKNMFRDQFEALIKSEHGYVPYIDLVRGMYHVLGKTDTFTKFLAAGGAQGLRQSLDRRYLQHDLRKILATSMRDKAMNVLKNPLEAMRALSELSEMGTRVGDFAKGIQKDSSRQGIKRAAVRSRDLMDFGRAGTWGRDINKISAFWNSQMQGLDKTIRVFTNPKTAPKAFAKASAFIAAPTAALYYKNKNDPRYQELPQWDKDLFWHFWVGKQHFRVPIPFELGVMFKVLPERLLAYTEGEDDSFRQLGQTVWESVDVIPDISALTPWIEAYANRNFIGAPIVPRREEGLLPEDQVGPYTSNTAKLIARIPGVNDNYVTERTLGSPRKVDHIIRGYTGSLGQYATQLIDTATDAAGITSRAPRPAADLSDKPLTKAFAGREFGGSTDSIDKFYDRFEKLSEQSKRAEKKGVYFEGAGELKYLEQVKNLIGDVTKRIRAVESDPNMSPKEKRDEIRRLNLMSNNFARMGLGLDQLEYEDVY